MRLEKDRFMNFRKTLIAIFATLILNGALTSAAFFYLHAKLNAQFDFITELRNEDIGFILGKVVYLEKEAGLDSTRMRLSDLELLERQGFENDLLDNLRDDESPPTH